MKSSKEIFRKGLDKAASGISLSPESISTLNNLKSSMKENEKLKGGKADKMSLGDIAVKYKVDIDILTKQFIKGVKVEMEHTDKSSLAKEIALDHLSEDPTYYTKLKKMESSKTKKENKEATGSGSSGAYSGPLFSGEEPKKVETKEATGSGSVGAYESPAAWAKSTGKKDWRGKSKTQIPGGSFVSVKKKCTKFPYCNSGDIKALDIYENNNVNQAILNVSKKMNISETTIKAILEYELEKLNK